VGESGRLAESAWQQRGDIIDRLHTPEAQRRPGDVYARRSPL
jgi:hypothetical protein